MATLADDGVRLILRGDSALPPDGLRGSFRATFDAVLAAIAELPEALIEPDGSVAWTGRSSDQRWRISAQLWDGGDRLDAIELFADCPAAVLDRFLAAIGQPLDQLRVYLATEGRRLTYAELSEHLDGRWAARGGD